MLHLSVFYNELQHECDTMYTREYTDRFIAVIYFTKIENVKKNYRK
jgi:hypothetical protein